MSKRDIFLRKEVVCPACKKPSEAEYPNPRLYVAAHRESDMRVTSYRWIDGAETDVLPHHYAVWQCQHCMFADIADGILGANRPTGMDALVTCFNKIAMNERLLLAGLRKLVPHGKLNFDGALAMHLAALFANYLPEKEKRNHNKLGRIALRTAWLFREQTGGEETAETESMPLLGLQERAARLETQLLTIDDILASMEDLSRRRASELGISGENENNGNPYKSVIESLSDKHGEMQTLTTMLQRTLLSDAQGKVAEGAIDSEANISGITNSLLGLKDKWAALPVNEKQSLSLAIDAFDYSYNYENIYQSIEQSMSVVNLIVDLFIRNGEHERALTYIGEIYKSGMRSKQELQSRLRMGRQKKTVSAHDERMINRKIGTINVAIRQAGDTRRRLIGTMIEHKQDTIDKVMAKVAEASAKEQIDALKAAGIADDIINELKARKLITEDKKKGLFGFGG